MVSGEIKVVRVQTSPTTYAPALRVCDGQMTATQLFPTQIGISHWAWPGRSPRANGEIIISTFQDYSGGPWATELFIGLNGSWWVTGRFWTIVSESWGGAIGEIKVVKNTLTDSGKPALLIRGAEDLRWIDTANWVIN